jgi:carboxyl-terminal processing protease
MKVQSKVWLTLGLASLMACQPDSSDPASNAPLIQRAVAPAANAADASDVEGEKRVDEHFADLDEPFPDGEAQFRAVFERLQKSYYRDDIGSDALYRAAIRGMLQFVEPSMEDWHALLSPRALAQLKADLSGQIVGVGAVIKHDADSGYTRITHVLDGSPAQRAGVQDGDTIVAVDGHTYQGVPLFDIVVKLRGETGTKVTLKVLRGDALHAITVTRGEVLYDAVETMLLDGDVGYLTAGSFSKRTPDALAKAIDQLASQGAKRWVLDLRMCEGGGFEQALSVADMMLPVGAEIIRTRARGGKEEVHTSTSKPKLDAKRLSVLVSSKTASGAEFVAAALQRAGAVLVGQKTRGKWSVQTLDELSNGYAIKYTTNLVATPDGTSPNGTGVYPDVEVSIDLDKLQEVHEVRDPTRRLSIDGALRTALRILTPSR